MPPKGWRKADAAAAAATAAATNPSTTTETNPMPSSPRTQSIATAEIPIPADLSTLPRDLLDHFAAQGSVCTLDSAHPNQVAQNSLRERYPLTVDDFPQEPDERAAMIRTLKRSGCILRPEGTFMRGDCYVYIQSRAAREALLADGRAMWLAQDPDENAANAAAEMNAAIIGKDNLAVGRVIPTDGGNVFTNPFPTRQ